MENGKFTQEEIEYLNSLDAVTEVHNNQIIYSTAFKKSFVRKYRRGKKPTKIFAEAGLTSKMIGHKRIDKASSRWLEAAAKGSLGMFDAPVISHRKKVEKLAQKRDEAIANEDLKQADKYEKLYQQATAKDKEE